MNWIAGLVRLRHRLFYCIIGAGNREPGKRGPAGPLRGRAAQRELGRLATGDAAHREPVPPIAVVGGTDVRRTEVEGASARTRVARSGPVVAGGTSIVERSAAVVPATQEAIGSSREPTKHSGASWVSTAIVCLNSRYAT